MKFLVLALCVCAVSAAPQAWLKQPAKVAAKAAVQTVLAPAVAAKAVYNAAKSAVGSSDSDFGATVLRSENEVSADGFVYAYETSNGISGQATGTLKTVENNAVLAFQGGYKYFAPDGTPVEVAYIADENGYQPQSDALPVGPDVPEYIRRSLEYIAAHPQPADKKY